MLTLKPCGWSPLESPPQRPLFRRVAPGHDSLCLAPIVFNYRAVTICMAERKRIQLVELLSKFLNARLQLCVILTQTFVFRFCSLGLLPLSQSALCCCDFVLLADSMFLLGEVGVGFVGTTVGIAYASGFSGFTTPLVCRMAVSIF